MDAAGALTAARVALQDADLARLRTALRVGELADLDYPKRYAWN